MRWLNTALLPDWGGKFKSKSCSCCFILSPQALQSFLAWQQRTQTQPWSARVAARVQPLCYALAGMWAARAKDRPQPALTSQAGFSGEKMPLQCWILPAFEEQCSAATAVPTRGVQWQSTQEHRVWRSNIGVVCPGWFPLLWIRLPSAGDATEGTHSWM